MRAEGQIWLAVTPQGLWGVSDGLFSPKQRGKGFHDRDIQSTACTINTDVLGTIAQKTFHKAALKVSSFLPCLYSTVSLSLPSGLYP